MGMPATRSLRKVIRRFWRIQQFRIIVQLSDIQGKHRPGRVLGIDEIPIIPVLHDEFLISVRPQQRSKQSDFLCGDLAHQIFAPGFDIFLRNAYGDQVIFRDADSLSRVRQLAVHKILNDAKGFLFIFVPVIADKGDIVRGACITQFPHA